MSHDDYYRSIKGVLTVIDFSPKEQEILIILLELKSGVSASLAAQELEVPRQTAYSLLKKLSDKGAVSIGTIRKEGNNSAIFLTSKEHLSKFIDDRCAALQSAKTALLKSII